FPELYSTGNDHVTIGSVTDEVFVGPAGRAAWEEFVQYVHAFTLRGDMRCELVTSDAGWLAANIDVGEHRTPYRFFYIWSRDEGGRGCAAHGRGGVGRPDPWRARWPPRWRSRARTSGGSTTSW